MGIHRSVWCPVLERTPHVVFQQGPTNDGSTRANVCMVRSRDTSVEDETMTKAFESRRTIREIEKELDAKNKTAVQR